MFVKYFIVSVTLAFPVVALAQNKSVVEVIGDLRADVEALKKQQPGSVQSTAPSFQNIEFGSGLASFKDGVGTTVANVGVAREGGGGMWLYNRFGKPAVSAEDPEGVGYLTVNDRNGVASMILQSADNGGDGAFYNSRGKLAAEIGVGNGGGGGAWIKDPNGNNLVFAGAGTDGKARLSLLNPSGIEFALLQSQDGRSGGMLTLKNSKGGTAVVIGNSNEEGGGAWFYNSQGDEVASLTSSKDGTTGVLYVKPGQDYAELFDVADRSGLQPGSVVSASPDGTGIALSDGPYDPKAVGVLSGAGGLRPAVAVGERRDGTSDYPVAVAGQVYVRVSLEGGVVSPGDLLVASSTRGVAMRATDKLRAIGAIVGKALESYKGSGEGQIRMLVMNH